MLQQKRHSAQDGQTTEDMPYLFVRPKGDAILLSCHTKVPAIPQSAIAPQPTWSNDQGQFATCIGDTYRARCYTKKHQQTLIVEEDSTHMEGSASRVRSDNDGCRRVTIAVPMTPPNCKRRHQWRLEKRVYPRTEARLNTPSSSTTNQLRCLSPVVSAGTLTTSEQRRPTA
jgi:hypothetical protein